MVRPPRKLCEFIGQPRVVGFLTRLIKGSQELGKPCSPLLMVGRPGSGKTTCAGALAEAFGSRLHVVMASRDVRPKDICAALRLLEYGDVLCFDEAHSLGREAQEILYPALDDQRIPKVVEGRIDRTQIESIAAFCLVMCTNEPGKVQKALRTRLTTIELERYSVRELRAIVDRVAAMVCVSLTPQAARRLAETAQGTPREIQKRVELVRCLHSGAARITQDLVEDMLTLLGVDRYGLIPSQREYLSTLAESPAGACTLERLSVRIGMDAAMIRQEIEPFLVDEGYVEPDATRRRRITARGRSLVVDWADLEDDEASRTGGEDTE